MRRHTFLLSGIILLGLALRLFILSQRGSLWFDETFSTHFASMDLGQMWHYLRFENNPPFYFILLHFWMKIFGNSELAARSLSMIFGLASIPLIYVIGKRLHSHAAGLFASFLLSISTFTVFYSTETRMYALYLFLTLIAALLFIRCNTFCRSTKSVAFAIALFILSLLIWTHITAWLIIAAFGFYLLWKEQFSIKKLVIGYWSLVILVAFLALQFLPWLINFIQLKFFAPSSYGVFFYIPPDKNFFLSIFENFLVIGQENAFVITILSIIIVLLGWLAIRKRDNAIKFLLSWLFIPLLVGFAFSNANPRYFIASALAFYLLLGIGFSRAVDLSRLPAGSMGATDPKSRICGTEAYPSVAEAGSYKICQWGIPLIIFTLVLASYPTLTKISHYEWDKLAKWIEYRELGIRNQELGTLVLINPHSEILPFERYYQGALPVLGIYPKQDNDDRDTRIVKTNWVSLNTKENIRVIADITKGYNQVFLVTGGIDPIGRDIAPMWFWENGWKKIDGQEFGRLSVINLFRP